MPAIDLELAIHDYKINSDGILIWFFKCRAIDDRFRIKDGDVREITRTQQAPLLQSHILCRQSGHLMYGKLQRHQLLIAHIAAKDARVRPPRSEEHTSELQSH